MMTTTALHDTLTDYANEKGDQQLIEQLTAWLNLKMSGLWTIEVKTNCPTCMGRGYVKTESI
jgi:hypothetical protein